MLESQLSSWTNPSSDTEQSKQERTERMIRQALDAHAPLNDCQFTVYTKGSYANNTNVRSDSDVDISVECTECIYWQEESIGAHPSNSSPYTGKWNPGTLRSEIIIALANKFPDQVDATGSTAIQINSSSARVDADVVPCFSFEYHFSGGNSVQGVKVFKTDGSSIENYPKQQIQYGRDKNNRTNYNYKKVVRILKRVQLLLVDADKFREVPSYFIESLVFNCPDELFSYSTWREKVRQVLIHIYAQTKSDTEPSENRWLEANNVKYLFHVDQKWTRSDARNFAVEAYNYLGFE